MIKSKFKKGKNKKVGIFFGKKIKIKKKKSKIKVLKY
jgi:hypothetical protein